MPRTPGDALDNIGTSALIRRILSVVLLTSLVIGAGGFYYVLRKRALDGAAYNARLLLTTAMAVSSFTDTEDFPLSKKLPPDTFFKQLVPFFAADAVFRKVQSQYPNYTFRQTALNPTNPADRPTPHEVEITDRFRDNPSLKRLEGTRQDGDRTLFYVAQPITVTDKQCLECHATPDMAPPAMVAAYGPASGFGWKLNETVGIMELSIPVSAELRASTELAALLAGGLLTVCLITYLALTASLKAAVVRPLQRLALAADAASLDLEEPVDLPRSGTSELRQLSDALVRLNTSLRKALRELSSKSAKQGVRKS